MPYTLNVNIPEAGQEIFIHGLGTFENGTHEISDEQAEQFRMINAHTELDEEGRHVFVPGPDLETAMEATYGVSLGQSGNAETQRTMTTPRPVDPGTGMGGPARTDTSESGVS